MKSKDAVGWLIDYAGPMDDALKTVWQIVTDGDHGLSRRKVEEGALTGVPNEVGGLPAAGDPAIEEARKAIMDCIQKSCGATLAEAIDVQAKHSGEFMTSKLCKRGAVGTAASKIMSI